jgi:hypothetical protein
VPSQVQELQLLLKRSQALADGLGDAPSRLVPSEERPGFFAPESGNQLDDVVDQLSQADLPITFVLGAGASMEAGLPSWAALVRGLVKDVAPRLREQEKSMWLEAVDDGGLLAAAATARAMSSSEKRFSELLWRHLYGGNKPQDYRPGPLCTEVAAFKKAFFASTVLITFNYDDLLERALTGADLMAEARIDDVEEPATVAVVRHLHGRLGPRHRHDPVVLTEADYARLPVENTWQSRVMSRALEGLCVFVGLSFNDPNLLRWVYAGGERRHLALFTRQSSPSLSQNVRRELERATRARLAQAGVDAYWADFYGELAQVVHEARRRRVARSGPESFLARAARVSCRGKRRCVPTSSAFGARQRTLSELLSALLDIVQSVAHSAGVDLADEHLGLALWGVDHELREVSLWASSDRLYRGTGDIVALPFELASRWAAVEAVTQCNTVEIDPRVYASRWRFIRGVPLVWDGASERIVVGAATLTSTTPADESRLAGLAGADKLEIDRYLSSRLVQLWR